MGAGRSARPTKADVARLANVSTATVTYVLNDVPGRRISEQTRQLVRAAAERLGYRPNLAARNLAVGGSGVVLYVVPRRAPDHSVLMEVGSRLTTALAHQGVVLALQFETEDDQNVVDAINDLNPIAVTSVFPLGGRAKDAVASAGIPQIHLGSAELHGMGSVHLDVGELRVGHLVARGHRTLAFAYSDNAEMRQLGDYWLAGDRIAARKHGLPEFSAAAVADDGRGADEVVAAWVAEGVTAVCAQSDETAFAVLHGIRRAGLRCPEDLAVIGANGGVLGALSVPPLTTVTFDATAIVEVSMAAMLAELGFPRAGEPVDAKVFSLIEREST